MEEERAEFMTGLSDDEEEEDDEEGKEGGEEYDNVLPDIFNFDNFNNIVT